MGWQRGRDDHFTGMNGDAIEKDGFAAGTMADTLRKHAVTIKSYVI